MRARIFQGLTHLPITKQQPISVAAPLEKSGVVLVETASFPFPLVCECGCDEAGPGEPWVAQQRVSTWTERGNAYLESAPSQRQDLDRQIAADGGGRPRGLGALDMSRPAVDLNKERREPAAATRRDAHAQHKPRCHRGAAVRRGRGRERERKTNVSASLEMFWCHRVMRIRRIHLPRTWDVLTLEFG